MIGSTDSAITADRAMAWNYKAKIVSDTKGSKSRTKKNNKNGKKSKSIDFAQSNMVNKFKCSQSLCPTQQAVKRYIWSVTPHQQSLINNTSSNFINMVKTAWHLSPKPRNMNRNEHVTRLGIETLQAMDISYRDISGRHSTLNLISKMTEGDYMPNLMKRHILPHIQSAALTYVCVCGQKLVC